MHVSLKAPRPSNGFVHAKIRGSTLAKRPQCARRRAAAARLPLVWTTPVPWGGPGWCNPWFCLHRGGVMASYSLVFYVQNATWRRLSVLSTARGAELGALFSCRGRGAEEGLVLSARLGISNTAWEQACCHQPCSEIPCLLGVLLSHFSDSQLVCWQEGTAQDPQCSETGIQDKKYLGACGIEPFFFTCSVCLLLKKSEFFLQFWIGKEDRLRIFKLFPIPPNNSFEDVWK